MASTPTRLYLRCLLWGLATGAATGAGAGFVIGAMAGDDLGNGTLGARLGVGLGIGLYGVVIGTLVALLPALIGAAVVTMLVQLTHPQPASADAVRRDVIAVGAGFAALLNVVGVALLWPDGVDGLAVVLVGDLCMALVLWPATASIARAWAGGGEDQPASSALSGRPKGSW